MILILQLAAQVALILYCSGSNIAYMVTVGDQLQEVCFYVTNTTGIEMFFAHFSDHFLSEF